MAELCKKRSRKSKLVPRECDLGPEGFPQDESSRAAEFLQDHLPPSTTLGKIKDKINQEVSYISSTDRSDRFSIEIEVEPAEEQRKDNDFETLLQDCYHKKLAPDERMKLLNPVDPYAPVIILGDKLASEVNKALLMPSELADEKIEVEIRNLWVKYLENPVLDRYDTMLQDILLEWRSWAGMSRHIRTSVFTYRCLVCSIGWWHFGPFRDHIRRHDNVKLNIESDCHECSIVASCGEWFELMCKVQIEGQCWRCLKTFDQHQKNDQYACEGCKMRFGTCFMLFKHEGSCIRFQKMVFEKEIVHESYFICELCDVYCLTSSRHEQHYKLYHDVRSDLLNSVEVRLPTTCTYCSRKYWILNSHVCSARHSTIKCDYCFRRFQNKFLLYMHNNYTKKNVYCQICHKHLPHQCMELEHYIQKHSEKYILMFCCNFCKQYVLFYNKHAVEKHSHKKHALKLTKKVAAYAYTATVIPIDALALDKPIGVTLDYMAQGAGEEQTIYPLGYNAEAFDKLLRETKALTDKRTSINILRKSTNVHSESVNEEAGCSKDLVDDDVVEIKDEIEVQESQLEEVIDYDNIDDDVIEEEEIEIQKFLERNITMKQENTSRNSPVQETTCETQGTICVTQETTCETHGTICVTQETTCETHGTICVTQETACETQRTTSETQVVNQETQIKKERLSIDELDIEESVISGNQIKEERMSFGEETACVNQGMISENQGDITDTVTYDIKKEKGMSLDQEPASMNEITTSENQETISETVRSDIKIEQTYMNQEIVSRSIETFSENHEKEVCQNKSTNFVTDDRNHGTMTTVAIKEEIIDSEDDTDEEFNIEQFVIKKEPVEKNKVFQSTKEFASVLNSSEKLVVEDDFEGNLVIKEEISDEEEDSEDMIVLADPTNLDSSPDDGDWTPRKMKRINIKKPGRLYSCKRCNFLGEHKDFRDHKIDCRRVSEKTSTSLREQYAIKTTQFESCPCSICKLDFSNVSQYLTHLPTHGILKGICPVCFETPKLLVSHLIVHIRHSFLKLQVLSETSEVATTRNHGMCQCKICSEKVRSRDFFKHWETHLVLKCKPDEVETSIEQTEENDFTLKADEVKALLGHIQTPNDFTAKACVLCGRAFNRRNDSKRHCIEHLLKNAFALYHKYNALKCPHCPKEFSAPYLFKSHLRNLGAMPIFKCEICDRTFSDSSNFAKHKKVHNIKILVCDICQKKFASKVGLQKHLQWHETTEPLYCKLCELKLYSVSALRKHYKSRHDKNKSFKCRICNRRFQSLKDTWDHLWHVHKERKYKADCTICHKAFRKFHDVKTHMINVHNYKVAKKSDLLSDVTKGPTSESEPLDIEDFLKQSRIVEMDSDEGETLVIYEDE